VLAVAKIIGWAGALMLNTYVQPTVSSSVGLVVVESKPSTMYNVPLPLGWLTSNVRPQAWAADDEGAIITELEGTTATELDGIRAAELDTARAELDGTAASELENGAEEENGSEEENGAEEENGSEEENGADEEGGATDELGK